MAAFDAGTGRQFAPTQGQRDSVELTSEMITAVDDPQARVVLHHNHPSSSSLSRADIGFLERPGVQAIVAHGHDGSMYSAQRGRFPLSKTVGNAVFGAVRADFQARVTARELPVDAADRLYNHVVWQVLSAQGFLDYRFGLAGETARLAKMHADFLAELEQKYAN